MQNQTKSEINNLTYLIIEYLYNLAKLNPMYKIYISEIIMSFPSKLLNNLEYSEIIISSIITLINEKRLDSLEIYLLNLDNLINLLVKESSSQLSWLEKKSSEIINVLINLLDKEKKSYKFFLLIFRILSKLFLFGTGYNNSHINFKKFPEISNIIRVNLIDKNNCYNKINFILDSIIDLFYQSKFFVKYKNYNRELIKEKLIKNEIQKGKFINEDELSLYLKFYKKCILFYFKSYKINYEDILDLKSSIINNNINNVGKFLQNENINKYFEINKIYQNSKKEFFKKIFQGYIYNFALLFSIFNSENNYFENNKKGPKGNNFENNIIMNKLHELYKEEFLFFDFICNHFILIILYQNYFNKINDIFDLDPFIIIESAFSFLKNEENNSNYIKKFIILMINKIFDCYFNFFDNNIQIIKKLEETNIFYLIIFDLIYSNKIGAISSISLLEILINKFNKYINIKYINHFIRCITIITYSYPEINDINRIEEKLIKIIDKIFNQFLHNDINFYTLNYNDFEAYNIEKLELIDINVVGKNTNLEAIFNFYSLFYFLRISFDEINTNLNSRNNNCIKISKYILDKIIYIFPQLKKILIILFQIDYNRLNIKQFFNIFQMTKNFKNPSQIISNINNNKTGLTSLSNYINKKSKNEIYDKKYIMPFFKETKIYSIISEKLNSLTIKINLRENNFLPFIESLNCLINYFEYCPELINEYIFYCCDKNNIYNSIIFLEIIKTCYYNILLDNYLISQIISYEDNQIENIYLILEKFLDNHSANFPFKININGKLEYIKIDEEIPFNYLEIIEKNLFENEIEKKINNVREREIYQIYNLVNLKIIMISKYIKILNYFINNKYINISVDNLPDEIISEFQKYKMKIVKIIIYIILNRDPKVILKEANSLLIETLKNDEQLKNSILKNDIYFQRNLNKIIIEFNNENIDKSNCSVNLDYSKGIQLKNLDFLLVLCKANLLDTNYINTILDKLQLFEQRFINKKINNSILLLYYRYISLIFYIQLYGEINIDKEIECIFNRLIEINKIFILQPLNQSIFFNKTKDFKKIVKFIMKNKTYFVSFIINKCNENKEWEYIFNFIKRIIKFESMSLIFEDLFKVIVQVLKNKIFDKEYVNNNIINDTNFIEFIYLIKICKIIAINYPLYLISSSFIELCDNYFSKNKNILVKYEKICKCWIDIYIIYLKNFKIISTSLFSFINYYTIENLPEYIKKKIELFLSNEVLNLIDSKIIVNIVNKYIKLNNDEKNNNLITNKLIIPLLIKYSNNVFLLQNDQNNNNNYNSNTLINLNSKILQKIISNLEIKEDYNNKLLSLIIFINKILIKDRKIIISNSIIRKTINNIQYTIFELVNKKSNLFPEYLLLCKSLSETLNANNILSKAVIENIKKFYFENKDIYNIINELLLFFCNDIQIISNLFKNISNENKSTKYNFYKIFIENPILINEFCEKNEKKIFINEIIICLIKEIKDFNKFSYKEKIIIINLIGLIISQRKKIFVQTFGLLYKLILELIQIIIYDNELINIKDNIDFLELLLLYYKELLKINTNFNFKLNLDIKEIKFEYGYYYYLYLLKINIINIPLEQIYTNIKEYIDIYQILIEKNKDNYSNKILLYEYCFILRMFSQKDLSERMNNINNYDYSLFLKYQIYMYMTCNKFLDGLYMNKEDIINYGIKPFNLQNTFFIDTNNILNNFLFPYLIKNNLYSHNTSFYENNKSNIDNYNNYNDSWLDSFPINNFCIFIFYYKFFNEFYSDKKKKEFNYIYENYTFDLNILKEFGNINNKSPINNKINNMLINSHIIINDNINNTYPSTNNDKSITEFSNTYNIKSNILKIKSNSNESKHNKKDTNKEINIINSNNIMTLKEKKGKFLIFIDENYYTLQQRFSVLLKKYFENFVYFSIFFLNEYQNIFNKYKKMDKDFSINSNKEYIDYFILSNNSLYFNLKDYTYIKNCNSEKIKYFNYNNKDLKKKIFLYYPDFILSGFNFFFKCEEIVEKYHKALLYLFILIYKHFKDKNIYDNVIEHLLNNVIFKNMYLLVDMNLENEFIYNLLTAREIFLDKIIIQPNFMSLFINHFKKRMKDTNLNSNYYNNKYFLLSFHLMLSYSIHKNLPQKSYLFDFYIKKYYSNKENIIDILKQIFTYNVIYEYSNDFIDFIPIFTFVILSCFKENPQPYQNENEKNFYYFKKIDFNKSESQDNMEIDENNNINEEIKNKYDKNDYIQNSVNNINYFLTDEINKNNIFDLTKNIIFIKTNYTKINQIFTSLFVQLWSTLKMKEKEELKIIINEFLDNYTRKVKNKNSYFLNILINTFCQCNPLIIIKPEILSSLLYYNNNWLMILFYLEHLITSGIEIPNCYNSLLYIFDYIKEPYLEYGLKKFFSEKNLTKNGINNLQNKNYLEAENIFYQCFEELNTAMEKINLEENNNNLEESYLSNIDNNLFKDLSTWESGLIECFKEKNEVNNIIKIENFNNNEELKDFSSWISDGENIDNFSLNLQNSNFNLNNKKIHCKNRINKKFYFIQNIQSIILNNMENENNSKNQVNYINLNNAILSYIHDYYKLPKNCENLTNYYFSLFQIIINEYENINLFQTLKLNNKKDNTQLNNYFKDYVFLLKQITPKISDKFSIFKKVIYQRNFLFNLIEIKDFNSKLDNNIFNQINILKYVKDLRLFQDFQEYLNKFQENNNQNINDLINNNPIDLYLKNIEYLKYIKKYTNNNELGITKCEEFIKNFNELTENPNNLLFINYVENKINRYKAYFYYKNGDIMDAHRTFLNILENNFGKDIKDYHIYYDWGILCEDISKMIKNEPEVDEWFENTIINYLYSIIYGINKSKYIIPILINYIKEFKDIKFSRKTIFEKEINEIPSWIWLFWISIIYDNFLFFENNREINDFYFNILKSLSKNHSQIIYYWNNIYNIIYEENNTRNKIIKINDEIKQKFKSLINIIKKFDKNNISKINIIIGNIERKLNISINDLSNIKSGELNHESFNYLDLSSLEFPRYYIKKIIQSYEMEKLSIKSIQYKYNINNMILKHILSIKASNEKKYNFIIKKDQYKYDNNIKLSILKILFNYIFNKDNYISKSKIFVKVPIIFYLTNNIKIEEEIKNSFDMEEIYDFCLQKRGFPSNINEIIFNEEKNDMKITNEEIFERMCEYLPQDSLKNFIHKIIVNFDDLFMYKKNFTNSFSINSFLGYLISDKMFLNNIKIKKDDGSLIIKNNNHIINANSNSLFKENIEKITIRLSKNISYFISYPGIYGIIPNIFYSSSNALIKREKKILNILKLIFENNSENYIFKLKYLINKDKIVENNKDKMDIEREGHDDKNDIKINEKSELNHSMININRIIDNSIDENILKNQEIELKLWF